jgi:RNA polymerase sigma-70 factor (ECF subfamily)
LNAPQRDFSGPLEFDVVFAQYGAVVWRFLSRLGVQTRDVPDICQEVFLVVHRRLVDFDPNQSSLRSWLYGICTRAASDYRRRHPNRNEWSDDILRNASVPGQPDTDLETRRAWARLAHVLDAMDAEKRQAFVLYELETLPMREIAAILECPIQTAYSRLHAARRLVLAAFRSEGEP